MLIISHLRIKISVESILIHSMNWPETALCCFLIGVWSSSSPRRWSLPDCSDCCCGTFWRSGSLCCWKDGQEVWCTGWTRYVKDWTCWSTVCWWRQEESLAHLVSCQQSTDNLIQSSGATQMSFPSKNVHFFILSKRWLMWKCYFTIQDKKE